MMTLRCTAALLRHWKFDGDPHPPASDAATGDWFGNVFKLGRRKYFLFVSAKTLVAVVTRAAPRFPLPEFVPALYQSMLDNGIPETKIQTEFTRLSPVTTAKTNDRRVLGSMNDMVRCLEVLHDRDGVRFDPTGPDARQALWEMPLSLLDMKVPVDALRAALGMKDRAPFRPQRAETGGATVPESTGQSGGDTRFAVRALLQRAEAENMTPPEILRLLPEVSRDPGGDLAWLAAHDTDDRIMMGVILLLFKATEDEALTDAARRRLREGAAPVLDRALRSPSVADKRKVMLGSLMHRLGAEFDEEEYRACFRDFDAAVAESLGELPRNAATPFGATGLLEGVGPLLDADAGALPADAEEWTRVSALCEHLADENPAAAGLVLGAACASAIWHGHADTIPLRRAIQCLGRTDSHEAMRQLMLIADWPFGEALGREAGQAYNEMLARGIRPRMAFAPTFTHGFVSSCDGSGARQLGLFFEAESGGRDSVLLLCKDTWGLKDAMAGYGDSFDVESLFRHGPREISVAPCTLALGRALFADAAALSLERGHRLPPQAYLCRQYLGEDLIPFERRLPDLSAYKLETGTKDAALVADSAALADIPMYGGLWFASDEAYAFIRKHGKGRALNKAQFERFVREVCVLEAADLLERLAVNLEVEALAGRAGRKANRIAAAVRRAIKVERAPFGDIPYIRELAKHSAAVIGMNVARGFKSQNDVNKETMERDEEIQRSLFSPDTDSVDW